MFKKLLNKINNYLDKKLDNMALSNFKTKIEIINEMYEDLDTLNYRQFQNVKNSKQMKDWYIKNRNYIKSIITNSNEDYIVICNTYTDEELNDLLSKSDDIINLFKWR